MKTSARPRALELTQAGYHVFPIPPGSKAPQKGSNGYLGATLDPTPWAAEHEARDGNFGIACGATGIVVIDVDVREDRDGEASWARVTESIDDLGPLVQVDTPHGRHLYWRTGQPVKSRIAWREGIDVKGDGGHVVAPGSTVGGKPYVVHGGGALPYVADLPLLPPWLAELVAGPRTTTRTEGVAGTGVLAGTSAPTGRQGSTPLGEAGVQAALARECELLKTAPEGERNDQLNRSAYNLGQLIGDLLAKEVARKHLTEAAHAAGLGQEETASTIESGLRSGMTNPRPTHGGPLPPGPGAGTWCAVDLTSHTNGTHTPETPTLMTRADGRSLLYPGRTHSIHGEPESGKSLLVQAEIAAQLNRGERILLLDFESDAPAVVQRLRTLGAGEKNINAGLTYVRPEIRPTSAEDVEAWAWLLGQHFTLAVIDGVTEALTMYGASTKDNDDITKWHRELPRAIAQATGAAVVLIDHVTKDQEGRGRFAIGGQAKLAALDGAAYIVDVVEPIGVGLMGTLSLRVGKDRPGGVRGNAGVHRKADRTQEAARITVDATTPGRTHVTFDPPPTAAESRENADEKRTDRIRFDISALLANLGEGEGKSKKDLEDAIKGRSSEIRTAVEELHRYEFIDQSGPTRGGSATFRSRKQYSGHLAPVGGPPGAPSDGPGGSRG